MLNVSHVLVLNTSLRIIFRNNVRLVEYIGINFLVFADVRYGFSELSRQLPLKVTSPSL